jgi:lysophospholipase L1-like esterase
MTQNLFARIRRVCRKTAIGLLPTLLLFTAGELIQRVRYSNNQNNPSWMTYGFRWSDTTPTVPIIPVSRFDYLGRFDPDAINVLCIGGSSTYGVFNDRRYTYPNLLNERLNQAVSSDAGTYFSVLNRGLPGQSAEDYRATFDVELAEYTPDVVILYTGYNDMFIKDVNRMYSTFSARLYTFWNVIERYSLLAITAKEKYLIWTLNQSREADEERERLQRLEQEFMSALELTLEPLVRRDVPVILIPEVLMARNFGGFGHNYESYAERYVNVPGLVEEVARRHGAEFVDLQQDFAAMDFKALFQDPVHLTDEGNRVLSRLIAERSTTLQALGDRDK